MTSQTSELKDVIQEKWEQTTKQISVKTTYSGNRTLKFESF